MITIITPTFNRETLVQATIKSILAQTFTNWELVIVDDGSTDDTESVIGKYLADTRIKYVKKANSGQAASLNVGATYANGDYITFLDSDDEAYSNWLEVVSSHIKEDTGIACVGAIRKLLDGTMIKEGMNEFKLFGKKIRAKLTCGSLFIKTNIFREIGGYDAVLRSNIQTDLGYRLFDYLRTTNLKIVVIEDYLVQINIHDGPRIRTNWNKRREGSIQFMQKHYDFLSKNDPANISNIYSVIAFSSYKLKNKKDAISYLFKAIRHNPLRWVNYLRIFKYALM